MCVENISVSHPSASFQTTSAVSSIADMEGLLFSDITKLLGYVSFDNTFGLPGLTAIEGVALSAMYMTFDPLFAPGSVV